MFDGEVPNGGAFTNISAFTVVGNSKLCGGIKLFQFPACPMQVLNERKQPVNHRVIVLIVTLTIVLLSLCILAIIYRNKRSRQQVKLASPLQNEYLQLSFGELFQATNGFSPSNLIGEGGYGSLYKGILNSDEQIIAVKVLKLHERGANKSFLTECEALKTILHRNVVKIITACSSIDFKGNDFKALVFEFMENGSLENWLHPSHLEQHEPKNLNFVQRLNIAIDVACASDYLHHHCEMAFIHCDLKPSNILLDGHLFAHVSDLGLAKIFSTTNGISIHQQSSSIGIRGTIGYVAPGEMENSPLLKIAEQDLRQLGLLQQAVHHLFPRVLPQLSTQASSTSSSILRGVNCCLAANYSEFGPRNKRGMTFLNFHIPVAVNSISYFHCPMFASWKIVFSCLLMSLVSADIELNLFFVQINVHAFVLWFEVLINICK
ncbi:hypothetical protein ACSBR1_041195 [Camellia fascicularis]